MRIKKTGHSFKLTDYGFKDSTEGDASFELDEKWFIKRAGIVKRAG